VEKTKKNVLFLVLIALVVAVFAGVTYTNNQTYALYINGEVVDPGDTIELDGFVYDTDLTLTTVDMPSVVLDSTTVATTAVATTTLTVTRLADVTVSIDVGATNAGDLSVYINSTDDDPIIVSADWEIDLSTERFYQIIIVNTATTTAYSAIIKERF
jgi:hypothetical protein